MDKQKVVILGARGFIGSAFTSALDGKKFAVLTPKRDDFDMSDPSTFKNTDFNDAIIIDCIAKIDGDKDLVLNSNYYNTKVFINYLKSTYEDRYRYIYLSSLSTLDKNLIASNSYILSKYKAESYIKEQVKDYKIIRISFPFGSGEKPQRLMSRLVNKAKHLEFIELDDIEIFLTPIEVFKSDCMELVENRESEINYLPLHPLRLEDVLKMIYGVLGVKENYSIRERKELPDSTSGITRYLVSKEPIEEQKKIIVTEIEKLVNEIEG